MLHIHQRHVVTKLDIEKAFNDAAQEMGYPVWMKLPDHINIEVQYMLENYQSIPLLQQISAFMQRDFCAFLDCWSTQKKVFFHKVAVFNMTYSLRFIMF